MSAMPNVTGLSVSYDAYIRHKGVTWHKRSGKWRVSLKRNGVNHHVGLFESHDEAIKAFIHADRTIHKEIKQKDQIILWFDLLKGTIDLRCKKNAGLYDGTGYKRVLLRRNRTKANHRLIYEFAHGVDLGEDQIDHINGVRDDNRLCNLRRVTNAENMQNLHHAHRDSMTGVKGVTYSKGKWKASICHNYKSIKLGTFLTKEDAIEAYSCAAKKLHKYNPYAKKD